MTKVKLTDVARACGVAPSTVSNALAGKGYVRKETRSRIQATAREMGYRPSLVARGLRLSETRTIGLLLDDVTNPYFSEIAQVVEAAAFELGYTVLLCNTERNPEKELAYLNTLSDKSVDGAILTFIDMADENLVRLQEAGFPFVLLGRRHSKFNVDFVGVDNHAAMAMAVEHLFELDHRQFAFVFGLPTSSVSVERLDGFRAALQRKGLGWEHQAVIETKISIEGGYEAAKQIADIRPFPTAVLTSSDLVAIGVLEGLRVRGYDVPGHVSVVGFDDISLSSLPSLQLTTVRQPRQEMGTTAVEMLVQRILRPRLRPRERILPPSLVVRKTTSRRRPADK